MTEGELDKTKVLMTYVILRGCCLLRKNPYIAIIAIPRPKMSENFKVNFSL